MEYLDSWLGPKVLVSRQPSLRRPRVEPTKTPPYG